jgi:hypothetical protein
VGKAYAAEKTPHMFVVDPQGVLVYRGGIDNAPIGTVDSERPRYSDSAADAVVNYVRGALEDMSESRALRLPDTPAYGCSVKYSSRALGHHGPPLRRFMSNAGERAPAVVLEIRDAAAAVVLRGWWWARRAALPGLGVCRRRRPSG